MSRVVVIGQAPGRVADPRDPLGEGGRSGDFLIMISGAMDQRQFDRWFERVNLLDRYPGPRGPKGDAFPLSEARLAAIALLPKLTGRKVIALGRGVQGAFGLGRSCPLLTWFDMGGVTWAVCPHPSPINHWWNAERNRIEASRFFGRALQESDGDAPENQRMLGAEAAIPVASIHEAVDLYRRRKEKS